MKWGNGKTSKPKVSDKYGAPRGGGRKHAGTDFVGYDDLYAIEGGVVTHAGWFNSAAGNAVVIDSVIDGQVVTICRFHAADGSITVRKGQTVKAGQKIGRRGKTGNATGPCDHVEIRFWRNGSFTTVDPEVWLAARIGLFKKANSYKEAVPVRTYQKELIRLGYDLGPWGADNKKGLKTLAALKAWQRKVGLTPDGLFGPLSKAKMFPPKPKAKPAKSKASRVTTASFGRVDVVQRALKTKYPLYARHLKIDNIDGPQTRAAVREFQRRSGLKADGIAGRATRRALGL